MAEIDLRIEGLVGKAEQEDSADALPDNVTGIPISQLGDLWLLGRHLLLCSNALDQQAYERVMDGKQATLVFADPPSRWAIVVRSKLKRSAFLFSKSLRFALPIWSIANVAML